MTKFFQVTTRSFILEVSDLVLAMSGSGMNDEFMYLIAKALRDGRIAVEPIDTSEALEKIKSGAIHVR